MFSKLITIFICFNIALSSRLYANKFNDVEDHFVKLEGEPGSDDHGFDPRSSQDEKNQYKQTSCGRPSVTPNTFLKIMGGVEARPHSWPWQVSVQNYYGKSYTYFCGGTIISATKVLSAAHCFFSKTTLQYNPIDNMYVVAGIHPIEDSYSTVRSQSKKVIGIASPGGYNPRNAGSPYDIAILYIAAPGFTFDDKVQPACLPSSYTPVGSSCYTTGWGNLWADQPNVYKKLYQVEVPILSHATCSTWLGQISQTVVCAGYPEGGKDSCQGDSGGPLVCFRNGVWILDGVVSWGNGCGKPKNPGVYTRVFYYINWINSR